MDLVQRLESVGLTHFSASQLNKPVANWMFDYVYLSSDERRKKTVGPNATFGTAVHEGIQSVLCSGQDIDGAIKDALINYDFGRNDVSCEKGVKFREDIPDAIHSGVNLLADDFTGSVAEHRIELELPDVVLPIIGFVDLFTEERFAEVKTKGSRRGAVKKDGTRGWTKGLLPKTVAYEHGLQAAIYNKATGAVPHVSYVSADGGVTFTPENCERLSDEALAYYVSEVRRKCILRQRLLAISDDPKVLAGLIEPDWSSFYWDEGENLQRAKELWKL